MIEILIAILHYVDLAEQAATIVDAALRRRASRRCRQSRARTGIIAFRDWRDACNGSLLRSAEQDGYLISRISMV